MTVLRVRYRSGVIEDIVPEIPNSIWRPEEVLWSPDSKAFIVNGGETSYSGYSFLVYQISDEHVVAAEPTELAQRDMIMSFPPCRARGVDDNICKRIEESPQFNMSAISWTRGSKGIIVFAEVPCSSSYGGIMCQVMGYELEARNGHILRRIRARELKRHYQPHMAWNMTIPEGPEYRLTRHPTVN